MLYLHYKSKTNIKMESQEFTLFWLNGDYQIVTGLDISSAMNNAGIGNGALRALDFYASGNVSDKWEWNKQNKSWEIKKQ